MGTRYDLGLHEEVVLLAHKNEQGTPAGAMNAQALAGAIVTELILAERIVLEPRRRGKPLVDLVRATQTGDPVLDDALNRIRTAKRRASVDQWVSRFARAETLHATARRLSRRGILRVEDKRVLLVFNRTVYPEIDPWPERVLIQRLEEAIFGDGEVDARVAVLVALADATGLLKVPFPTKALRGRKKRIKELAEGAGVTDVARATVEAVRAAVAAAVVVATAG
jgi:Golgi phosphoprotein 3